MNARLAAWLRRHQHTLLDLAAGGLVGFLVWIAASQPAAPAPVSAPVATPHPVIANLPPGYHADANVVFVLLTAPLQTTSIMADRESLAAVAAAYPNQRVCVIGADSDSIERDSTGREWYAVLGYFCMPPAAGKEKAAR